MDQSVELNYWLQLVNYSSGLKYNFSESTALALIEDYVGNLCAVHHPATIALICFYVPVFIMSLGGNGLAIFVVCKNAHMRQVKNLFLLNLSLADLLVTLICMPLVVGAMVCRLWVFGEFMCKLTGYMQGVAVSSSIFTLTALSVDRYLAIKAPLSNYRITTKAHVIGCLTVIWLLALIFLGPILITRRVRHVNFLFHITASYCVEDWHHGIYRQAYSIILLITTYIAPMIIIGSCYVRIGRTLCSEEFHRRTTDRSSSIMTGRKRVARMLVALIVVFVVCWMPYNICSLILDVNLSYQDLQVLPFTLWIGHAHSAINPVLYWYLNRSFRYSMRRALRCRHQRDVQSKMPTPHYV